MQKYLIIILLVSICYNGKSADSTKVSMIENQIVNLENENRFLSERIETLSKANDKFLNVTYATIGFCLMTILGLSIWNGVSASRLDKKRYQNFINEFRNEINNNISKDINQKVDSKIQNKLTEIESIKSELVGLEIDILRKTHKRLQKKDLDNDDYEASIKYLKLSNKLYKSNNVLDYNLKDALKNIRDLLVQDKDWIDGQIDEIVELLPGIDTKFERYINEIKTILKI
ncbi:MAG: hypothetical protein GY870_09025 [archaeon]|nr:hypothetical protein [archaeon]